MPSLDTYRRILGKHHQQGQVRIDTSNAVIEHTWWEDPNAKECYIYDYAHDDEPLANYKLKSQKSKVKTKVDCKIQQGDPNDTDGEQNSYKLQFRPSYKCSLDYFASNYEDGYGVQFPIGLYIDIPDSKGYYRRWLICSNASVYGNSFARYNILPCDTCLRWIEDNGMERIKRRMWGVKRNRSVSGSGLDVGTKITVPDDQNSVYLPMNDITEFLYYDQRLILSAPLKKQKPFTWKISKIVNTMPVGLNKITLAQDQFNERTDYIDPNDKFEMYADYYKDESTPIECITPVENIAVVTVGLSCSGKTSDIKIGGSAKTITVVYSQGNAQIFPATDWKYKLIDSGAEKDIPDGIFCEGYPVTSDTQCKLKISEDDSLIGKALRIYAYDIADGVNGYFDMDILSL